MLLNQEEQNRGKPNWEHLTDELHVLLTVEDTENRATLKLARAVEEVKKLLVPVVRKFQLYTLLFPLLLDDNSLVREEREERSRRETFSHERVFFFFSFSFFSILSGLESKLGKFEGNLRAREKERDQILSRKLKREGNWRNSIFRASRNGACCKQAVEVENTRASTPLPK